MNDEAPIVEIMEAMKELADAIVQDDTFETDDKNRSDFVD